MIFLQVFLAILAALFVIRLVVWRRMRRMGFGRGFGHHRGPHGRARSAWRLLRELDLDRSQRTELRRLFGEVRQQMSAIRGELPRELAQLLGQAEFDRVTAERVADERFAALVRAKDSGLELMAKVHAILTPAQRSRLAAFAA